LQIKLLAKAFVAPCAETLHGFVTVIHAVVDWFS
jgi:hypothetical protein